MKPILFLYFYSADPIQYYEVPYHTDVLSLHGKTYRESPLSERQENLIQKITSMPQIKYPDIEPANYSAIVCVGWCY